MIKHITDIHIEKIANDIISIKYNLIGCGNVQSLTHTTFEDNANKLIEMLIKDLTIKE